MRIALLSTPFVAVPPKAYGGTELIVYELAEGLTEAGHDVTLFATQDSSTQASLRALFSEERWPPEPLTELNHISWAMSEVATDHFDLIHTHSAFALGMSRLLPHIPLIYTIHHTLTPEFSDLYRSFPNIQYIAISHSQKRLEIPLPHCEVIHHGLSPQPFQCDSPEDYVCFIGRLAEVKGPHLAIDAAHKANIPLFLAGSVHSPDREFFQSEIKPRLNLPHVKYLNAIGLKEKTPLLQKAKALLAPIQWEEPFGLILIEAMLSGCPPVAFPRGSVPELIEEGVTGFIAHSLDDIAEIIRPGGPLECFDRCRCRNRALERFSRTRMIKDHLRLYHKVLTSHA